jgi:hypothetical protein
MAILFETTNPSVEMQRDRQDTSTRGRSWPLLKDEGKRVISASSCRGHGARRADLPVARPGAYVVLGCSVAFVSAAWWPMNSNPA